MAFEFILVIYVLISMGLIKPQKLADSCGVIIAVVAAAIAPTVGHSISSASFERYSVLWTKKTARSRANCRAN